jgi:hypothetical protein
MSNIVFIRTDLIGDGIAQQSRIDLVEAAKISLVQLILGAGRRADVLQARVHRTVTLLCRLMKERQGRQLFDQGDNDPGVHWIP